MKKLIPLLVIYLLLNLNVQPIAAQKLSDELIGTLKNEVDSFFYEMIDYAEKLDYDKLSSAVDDRYHAGFISNKKYYSSYSDLFNELKPNLVGVSKQVITIKEKKTTVLSDYIALMTVAGVANVILNDDRTFSNNFHWSFLYEKIDGNWKVIHSHQSLVN